MKGSGLFPRKIREKKNQRVKCVKTLNLLKSRINVPENNLIFYFQSFLVVLSSFCEGPSDKLAGFPISYKLKNPFRDKRVFFPTCTSYLPYRAVSRTQYQNLTLGASLSA